MCYTLESEAKITRASRISSLPTEQQPPALCAMNGREMRFPSFKTRSPIHLPSKHSDLGEGGGGVGEPLFY